MVTVILYLYQTLLLSGLGNLFVFYLLFCSSIIDRVWRGTRSRRVYGSSAYSKPTAKQQKTKQTRLRCCDRVFLSFVNYWDLWLEIPPVVEVSHIRSYKCGICLVDVLNLKINSIFEWDFLNATSSKYTKYQWQDGSTLNQTCIEMRYCSYKQYRYQFSRLTWSR